jgi:endonuclease YncB( thermonuclease family)
VDAPESSNNFKLWRDAKQTGQDTKEILEKGKEAAEFTRKLVEGKQVRLEYDVQKKDKYGRMLAYVYLREDMTVKEYKLVRIPNVIYDVYENGKKYIEWFVNAYIVQEGYAQVITPPDEAAEQALAHETEGPNVKYQELFVKLEKEAREQKKGLWWDAAEADQKKLNYKFGIEDATSFGNVRASNAKVGADYKVSENATVGVEARQGIHDAKDAAAWGQSVDDETAAQAKYKLSF